jgi:hypothetical protein
MFFLLAAIQITRLRDVTAVDQLGPLENFFEKICDAGVHDQD